MGKQEELLRTGGANLDESLGVGLVRGGPAPATPQSSAPERWQGVTKSKNAVEIPVGKIDRDPNQPREEFDDEALGRLAESLKSRGQLQPIRVRWDEGQGVYRVVVGERRWRAAKMAGLATLTAVVMDGEMNPDELLAVQLVENALREDLNPVEQARAYKRLIDSRGWSVRQLASELAISHVNVVRAMALLDLPESVQGEVESGRLTPTTAYELSKVGDDAAAEEIGRAAVEQKLTGAQVREAVQSRRDPRPRPVRHEIRTTRGAVVSVTLPPGLDLAAELRDALRKVKATSGGAEAA